MREILDTQARGKKTLGAINPFYNLINIRFLDHV